jgi:hypothetical protein
MLAEAAFIITKTVAKVGLQRWVVNLDPFRIHHPF